MKARINVTSVNPDGYKALLRLGQASHVDSLPDATIELVKLRASQINGCSFCVDMHAHEALEAGETVERLFAVAAWREAPFFTDAERAALALTEAATRIADAADPVTDEIWEAAAAHYDEAALAALIYTIAGINAWNTINGIAHTPAGAMRKAAAKA